MQPTVSYKTIFRLDYDLSFRLLDYFGHITEVVHKATSVAPFSNTHTELNLAQNSFSTTARCGEDGFKFNLSLTTMNAVIEHSNGTDVSTLHNHPALKLADLVIKEFDEAALKKMKRVGFRTWLIYQGDDLKFSRLRDHFLKRNAPISSAVHKHFEMAEDFSATFESARKNSDNCRVAIGPYKEEEKAKYFSMPVTIKEGFMIDIDIWQNNCELPEFSVVKNSRHYFQSITEVGKDIRESLLEDLKK
jgi:hypothetical protein